MGDAGASNSLFLYNKGKTTETYTDRAHHENFLAVTSKPLSQTFGAAKVSEAEQACADAGLVNDKKNNKQDLDNCVLDALVLEDVDIATRSAGSAEVRKGNVPRIEGDFDEGIIDSLFRPAGALPSSRSFFQSPRPLAPMAVHFTSSFLLDFWLAPILYLFQVPWFYFLIL